MHAYRPELLADRHHGGRVRLGNQPLDVIWTRVCRQINIRRCRAAQEQMRTVPPTIYSSLSAAWNIRASVISNSSMNSLFLSHAMPSWRMRLFWFIGLVLHQSGWSPYQPCQPYQIIRMVARQARDSFAGSAMAHHPGGDIGIQRCAIWLELKIVAILWVRFPRLVGASQQIVTAA